MGNPYEFYEGFKKQEGGYPKNDQFRISWGKKTGFENLWDGGEIPEKLRRFVRWGNPGTGGASHVDMVGPKRLLGFALNGLHWVFQLSLPTGHQTWLAGNPLNRKVSMGNFFKYGWLPERNHQNCHFIWATPMVYVFFFLVYPVYLISGQSITFWTICTSCLGPKIQHSGAGDGLDTLIILGYGYVSMV